MALGDPAPVVGGLTETSPQGDSLIMRLTAILSRSPGGSSQDISNAMGSLQAGYGKEEQPDVRSQIAAALSILGGSRTPDDAMSADTARDTPTPAPSGAF